MADNNKNLSLLNNISNGEIVIGSNQNSINMILKQKEALFQIPISKFEEFIKN